MEGNSMKLGLCIVNLAIYLYCMDHHSFHVEIHRYLAKIFSYGLGELDN